MPMPAKVPDKKMSLPLSRSHMESFAPIPARARSCAFRAVKAAPTAFRVLCEAGVPQVACSFAAIQEWSGKPRGVFPAERWVMQLSAMHPEEYGRNKPGQYGQEQRALKNDRPKLAAACFALENTEAVATAKT